MAIYQWIHALLTYGLESKLMQASDAQYVTNKIFSYLNVPPRSLEGCDLRAEKLDDILDFFVNWAFESGRIESKSADFADIFDSGLMDCMMQRPSETIDHFWRVYENSPQEATAYLHEMGKNANYIRMRRIGQNRVWKTETPYGTIDISINLSKPEKDPVAIAKALEAKGNPSEGYPKCLLCIENEGFMGHVNHPARQNLRLVPITLNGEDWRLQYSPYAYYEAHCIVLCAKHVPMKLTKETFIRLLDFVDQFPHYFVGSNADLPIVGGSILTHDHFQGGAFDFAMAKAQSEKYYKVNGLENVEISRVKWPMSVLRLKSQDKIALYKAADDIYRAWQGYSDVSVGIVSHSEGTSHNTVTPIARKTSQGFEIDLVLRNNRTSSEHPEGIFHPHREIHGIKKENIGLIEVMGLAVLPGRLAQELEVICKFLMGKVPLSEVEPLHRSWSDTLIHTYGMQENYKKAWEILEHETGHLFLEGLHHAGVFKRCESGLLAFDRFVESL